MREYPESKRRVFSEMHIPEGLWHGSPRINTELQEIEMGGIRSEEPMTGGAVFVITCVHAKSVHIP